MVIETERLLLREMTDDDFHALYKVLSNPDIMQHYPYAFDENRVKDWIVRNIKRYRVLGFGLWAVCLKSTGEMIGDKARNRIPHQSRQAAKGICKGGGDCCQRLDF